MANNDTDAGLVAYVYTRRDGARQVRMAEALAAGMVGVNEVPSVSTAQAPFGGIKHPRPSAARGRITASMTTRSFSTSRSGTEETATGYRLQATGQQQAGRQRLRRGSGRFEPVARSL